MQTGPAFKSLTARLEILIAFGQLPNTVSARARLRFKRHQLSIFGGTVIIKHLGHRSDYAAIGMMRGDILNQLTIQKDLATVAQALCVLGSALDHDSGLAELKGYRFQSIYSFVRKVSCYLRACQWGGLVPGVFSEARSVSADVEPWTMISKMH